MAGPGHPGPRAGSPAGLFGQTSLRVDDVLIGPGRLKDTVAVYNFFRPRNEINFGGGCRYSGKYPDFAYPSPKGTGRYWWAGPERKGDGWVTPDYHKVEKYVPMDVADLLLKFDLKAGSPEAKAQAELVEALVVLNGQRSRLGQLALPGRHEGVEEPVRRRRGREDPQDPHPARQGEGQGAGSASQVTD